jgi:lysyl endopeptidase
MKKAIIFLILISVLQVARGQVETKYFPKGDVFKLVKPIKDYPKTNKTTKLPSFDAQKLIDEDKLNERGDLPFRFGKGFDTGIALADGEWNNVEEGWLWSMGFQSYGAYSINFVFDQFSLSDSAKLYVTNAERTMLYGPVTSKQNTKNGYFLTDLIQGDDVTIYLYEPNSEKGKSKLSIKRVVHAYKDLFPELYGNLGGSDTCNNDIACFPAWDDESDAVALVLLSSGTEWCSGSLLMTANQSFRPYFLTAFHCIDSSGDGSLSTTEISNSENWMFKFQYKMTACGGSTATTGITYNGAEYRAAWNDSDFALMEMDNSPIGDTRFSWLGWDRSGNTPTSGTSIHHPSGDVMKISFDSGQLNSNNNQLN